MKKTSLYIDPATDRALARRAAVKGVTKAEFVRQALADAVKETAIRPTGCGVFDGPGDLATDADRRLAETGFAQS